MDIPFNLTLYAYRTDPLTITRFAESYKILIEDADAYTVEVRENCDLEVFFELNTDTSSGWTLEIDFLDGLPEKCFTYEELQARAGPCFFPSDKKRPLYLDTRSKIENIPGVVYPMLIPGTYKIVIRNSNECYFAFLKIIPLRIDDDQLEVMRDEIETYITGLSLDFKRKSNMDLETNKNKNSYIYKTDLFIENYSKIISALNRIMKDPKYSIVRNYSTNEVSKSGRIDHQTIRFKQRRMDMHDKLLTYTNTIKYNVKENQMMKFIIYNLQKDLQGCLRFIKEKTKRDEEEVEVIVKYLKSDEKKVMAASLDKNLKYNKEVYRKLILISNHFNKFVTVEWISFVENINYVNHPRLLASNRNYNRIYTFYLQINRRMTINNNPLKNYNYYWRESSKLYEIWGFLKLKEAIEECGYNLKPVDGWIYDKKIDWDVEEIPFLDPGTRIIYENEEQLKLKLILYYDSTILHDEETTIENPVYTLEQKDRPDIRVDIYISGLYIKTIIGDFKYRPHSALGSVNDYIEQKNPTGVYNQLVAYSYIKSRFIGRKEKRKGGQEAAHGTWVFYPEKSNVVIKRGKPFDPSTNIRRIEMSPNKEWNMESIINRMRDTIQEIIEDA